MRECVMGSDAACKAMHDVMDYNKAIQQQRAYAPQPQPSVVYVPVPQFTPAPYQAPTFAPYQAPSAWQPTAPVNCQSIRAGIYTNTRCN
jgi:hypothetical protein